MQAVVIAIIAALINGAPIESVLAGLTMAQWITLTTGTFAEIEPELAKVLGLPAAPSPGSLIDSVIKVASDELAKKAVKDWLTANGNAAIEQQPGAAGQ